MHKLINTQIIVKMVPERFPIAIFKNIERYCVPKKCSIHKKKEHFLELMVDCGGTSER